MATYDLGQTRKVQYNSGASVETLKIGSTTIWEQSTLPEFDKIGFHFDGKDAGCYSGSGTSIQCLDAGLDLSGVVRNGPTYNSSDGSFDFDGINDYLDFQNNATIDVDTEGFTISVWFKSDTNHNGVVWSIDSTPERMFQIKKKSAGAFGPVFLTGTSSSSNQNKFTSGWSNGVWYHCVVTMGTYSSNMAPVQVYRNNNRIVNSTTYLNMASASPDIAIGRQRSAATSNSFNGKIGPIIFWNTVLSSSEITTVWNLQKANFGY
tara:strand:+ start:152 stop:940 length:789 start_codon:yes stop_codon:yes gene_type:complete